MAASLPSWPTLQYGQSQNTNNVFALQCLLNNQGFSLSLTGIFDLNTRQALLSYQKSNNLTEDGVAGGTVLESLVSQVVQGTQNYNARAAQYLLSKFASLSTDGSFGPASANALAAFQRRMGILITGVVNDLTWQYLFGYNTYPTTAPAPTSPSTTAYATITAGSSALTAAQMTTNAKYVYNYLINEDLNKAAACGILGNMQLESGIDPGVWEQMSIVSKGYGLVQWTPATVFLEWAAKNNEIAGEVAAYVNALAANDPVKL